MEFHIENTEVYGLNKSIIASGNAMRTKMDSNLIQYFDYWEQFYEGNFLKDFADYYLNYNKDKGKNNKNSCKFCGASTHVEQYQNSGNYYCSKHRHQLERYEKVFETTPEYILLKDKVQINIRGDKEKISSVFISYESLPDVFYACPSHVNSDGYTILKDGTLLHRFLLRNILKENEIVDHINKDVSDNCLENLRIVTSRENVINASVSKNNTSGFIGVSYRKDKGKFRAYIMINKKQITLGHYSNLEDAVKARLQGEKEYFGIDFAPQRHLFKKYGIISEQEDNNIIKNDYKLLDVLKRIRLGRGLGKMPTGCGEDNYLNGVIVQFDLYAPLYMWKQIQRYHFLDFISSQSTMHRLAKFGVEDQCVSDTDHIILYRYKELLNEYNEMQLGDYTQEELKKAWRVLVASLPSGFVLGATMTTNYRQLKTMYLQRKNHKLKEWQEFCKWCESLPSFIELCIKQGE